MEMFACCKVESGFLKKLAVTREKFLDLAWKPERVLVTSEVGVQIGVYLWLVNVE
jgi:hypothetical protein